MMILSRKGVIPSDRKLLEGSILGESKETSNTDGKKQVGSEKMRDIWNIIINRFDRRREGATWCRLKQAIERRYRDEGIADRSTIREGITRLSS
jgi:hypothetical protein